MSDLPKQELDELFREGADMQTFEYNEAAWDKMEVMLDRDDRKRRVSLWILLLVGVTLAVISGLYYNSLESNTSQSDLIFANENSELQSSDINNEIIKQTISNESNVSLLDNETVVINEKTIQQEIKNTEVSRKNIASINTENVSIEESGPNAVSKRFNANNESASTYQNETNSNHLVNPEEVVKATAVVKKEISDSEFLAKDIITVRDLGSNVVNTYLDKEFSQLKNNLPFVDVDYLNDLDPMDDSPSIASRFSYSLFAAPEWSSVGADGPKERGYKFGAKVGFQLTNHWELSTGLSLSQKKFNGKGSQFTISEGWVDDIMPMTMAGKCNIFEIPLDVVYHFSGVGENGFYASAGLRAYMLHSEWYGFEYNTFHDSNPDLIREKVMDNENKNWLGSIELSLGYTQKVNNNLSVQVAPYLQIPATGFGDGKVNLYSGGVQFAVRFDGK